MKGAFEELGFLTNSPARLRLLEELCEHGRLEKHRLRERVDASRTTVQRNLDALEERGWVRGNTREYWITRSGQPVAERLLEALTTVHAAKRVQPLLQWLPDDEFDLDVRALATADVTVSEETAPYAPVERHVDLMRSAEEFRCLLPAVGLQPMTVAQDRIVEQDCTHEVVLDEDVAETLRSRPVYREVVEELLASERCDLLVTEREVPFYLGLAPDAVQIGVGDADGVPRGLVETGAEEVRAWAERTFAGYQRAADPLAARWPTPSALLENGR